MQLDFKDFTEEELESFYKIIGNNVKKVRQNKSVTQMQLANAIGHNSVGHIAKAELNKYGKHFSIENLYKISKILDVPISVFFDEEE
jgi:transcriptional regulator with XRE-family HTH domain